MKKKYLLFSLIILFGFGLSFSQTCPESVGTQSTTSVVHFKIISGNCNSYPNTITIEGKSLSKTGCNGTNLYYTLDASHSPLSSPDSFSVDFGSGICSYVDGERQTLSADQVDDTSKFNLYPNPVNNGGMINLNFKSPVNAEISIYDLTGKRLIAQTLSSSRNARLNLSGLLNGIYLIKVESDQLNATRKIIIQR